METVTADKMVVFTSKTCLICGEGEDEYNLGILHDLQVFSVHYLCLLTGIDAYPSTCNEGLLGFLLGDIYMVYKRYLNALCDYCKKSGASLECTSCKKKYHLPCGLRKGARLEMRGCYPSYCRGCASDLFPKSDKLRNFTCVICLGSAEKDDILYWPSCCKPKNMIHFDCLKLYALSSGYLTKCPLCNNKSRFRSSIRKLGVYIPNTDAEWLVEKPDEYISYPLRCCANICIMRSGCKLSTILTPCIICERRIAHMECTFTAIFLCLECTNKLWPHVRVRDFENVTANLSETFPWFFELVENIKYGRDLVGVLDRIYKILGERMQEHELVEWHNVLDDQSSNLIATKLMEYYEDYVLRKCTGELVPKNDERKDLCLY